MASLQQKSSRGQKYWYIVESRRVNGKPRPVVLAYLGKADTLLERLQHLEKPAAIKSYSHGAVAALLRVARELDIVQSINQHIHTKRKHFAPKPLRNNLTAGATLLLGAMGRACMPASKRGWWAWAKTTSCEYMLHTALSKVDSQHFWDLMDAVPLEQIETIETELLKKARMCYGFNSDSLFYDTTNFFTFIATDNERCTIARRGKNKQKRNDLRQVGLALVVTREDKIPLFHLSYQGNCSDSNVFKDIIARLRRRFVELELDLDKHTLVFDRGNNSKTNMAMLTQAGLHYVGALTPYQHRELIEQARDKLQTIRIAQEDVNVYRTKSLIWGEERTLLVFISQKLKQGQWRGICAAIEKAQKQMTALRTAIEKPDKRHGKREDIEARISAITNKQFIREFFVWELFQTKPDCWLLQFHVDQGRLEQVENALGWRILMTDRHDWDSAEIIRTFHGQANIENAFRDVKNPYHLAVRPQFHWTDQKIAVHFFMCVMGYLMSAILLREAREKAGFQGDMDTLLDKLSNVRLAACMGPTQKSGHRKIVYKIEELDEEEKQLMDALNIAEEHQKRQKINGFSVYT
jgi:transposase